MQDLAQTVADAEAVVGEVTLRRLELLAKQMQAIREQAERVISEGRRDAELNRASCAFRRSPGRVYHLYRRDDGALLFSMLSPAEWRGNAPYAFEGSYRLEADQSWTPVDEIPSRDDLRRGLAPLLPESS